MLRQITFIFLQLLLTIPASLCVALPSPSSHVVPVSRPPGRKLTGKFLHITDVHPDPFYKTYSSTEEGHACHRGSGAAGIYGAETSDCDSPISLLDQTFRWINDTIRDDIDFIIWTGDSARHDNDEKIPRSEKQVVDQNKLLVSKFLQVFGKPDNYDDDDPTNDFIIPIIPNFGNNDILPHNIFTQGPNKWTKRFTSIWRQFIPEDQRHQFQRGGWFFVEVIPQKLVVFSLNTLYFFDSNSAVDGCAVKSEPGYEHFEWLRIQLQILRERGMKAILTGHVPPARVNSKTSWDETCWQKYTLWMQQYRDVVLGSMFGHMNIDHFMLQDFRDIKKHVRKGVAMAGAPIREQAGDEITAAAAEDYLVDLRDTFSKIPSVSDHFLSDENGVVEGKSWTDRLQTVFSMNNKSKHKKKHKDSNSPLTKIGGEYGERYSLSFVGPSVVPNYFPTLRVFEYNITGLEDATGSDCSSQRFGRQFHTMPIKSPLPETDDELEAELDDENLESKLKKKDEQREQRRKKPKRHKFKLPDPPAKTSPPGPAYSPQTLTLLGYTQYSANITHINNDFTNSQLQDNSTNAERWKPGHHHGKVKHGKPHPKHFTFKVEYDTTNDNVFRLADLTVRSYIQLAKRIAESAKGHKNSLYPVEDERDVNLDSSDADENTGRGNNKFDVEKNKDKKKRKKHKHKKNKQQIYNKVWHTFVRRAFVGTMDPTEIESEVGSGDVKDLIAHENEGSLEL